MAEIFFEAGELAVEGAEVAAEGAEALGEVADEGTQALADALSNGSDDLSDVRRALNKANGNSSSSSRGAHGRIRVTARLAVSKNFGAFGRQVETAVIRGLEATGRRVLAETAADESRVLTGHLKSSISLSPVYRTTRGYAIEVYSTDPNALWQEKGTRAKRGRAKTKRTRDRRLAQGISHGGVKPLRFFKRGASGAASRLVDEIRAAMR